MQATVLLPNGQAGQVTVLDDDGGPLRVHMPGGTHHQPAFDRNGRACILIGDLVPQITGLCKLEIDGHPWEFAPRLVTAKGLSGVRRPA